MVTNLCPPNRDLFIFFLIANLSMTILLIGQIVDFKLNIINELLSEVRVP